MSRRVSLLAVAGLLLGLAWTATVNGREASVYVAQAGHRYSARPEALRFAYQPSGLPETKDGDNVCSGRGNTYITFARVIVTPEGMPTRRRFIECSGRVRSGRRSTAIPAGVGFYR